MYINGKYYSYPPKTCFKIEFWGIYKPIQLDAPHSIQGMLNI